MLSRFVGRMVLFAWVAACLSGLSSPAMADDVAGFRRLVTPDGVVVGLWYPAVGHTVTLPLGLHRADVAPGAPMSGGSHPLIVMSHGTGGSYTGHLDTAVALAQAGFIVAALTHPGDNWQDQSRSLDMPARPRTFSHVIDWLLAGWDGHAAIDPARIGAFGFSAGGFTVLVAAGGKPDLTKFSGHCAAHPAYFDCKLAAGYHPTSPPQWPAAPDNRIRAVVVAAPALGFTFAGGGLSGVTVPVQLWRADRDQFLPAPDYADAVRAELPASAEFHSVPGAGHFDFLAPCNASTAPLLCDEVTPGFDRIAFHQTFNADVVRFFRDKLGVTG